MKPQVLAMHTQGGTIALNREIEESQPEPMKILPKMKK
jgi:hypothetical protein